jgi:uncharacterized OB-fold protein
MSELTPPLPDVSDVDFRPFWTGCAAGRLLVQRCRGCGRLRWPPRPACVACLEFGHDWVPVGPTGTVFSWTTTVRAPAPRYAGVVPYTTLLVEVDGAGLRFLGNLDGPAAGLRIGAPVQVVFRPAAPGVRLPCWRLLTAPAGRLR